MKNEQKPENLQEVKAKSVQEDQLQHHDIAASAAQQLLTAEQPVTNNLQPITESETKNMEVHHHPHVEKKNFDNFQINSNIELTILLFKKLQMNKTAIEIPHKKFTNTILQFISCNS